MAKGSLYTYGRAGSMIKPPLITKIGNYCNYNLNYKLYI